MSLILYHDVDGVEVKNLLNKSKFYILLLYTSPTLDYCLIFNNTDCSGLDLMLWLQLCILPLIVACLHECGY